jgi:hypothetical protein
MIKGQTQCQRLPHEWGLGKVITEAKSYLRRNSAEKRLRTQDLVTRRASTHQLHQVLSMIITPNWMSVSPFTVPAKMITSAKSFCRGRALACFYFSEILNPPFVCRWSINLWHLRLLPLSTFKEDLFGYDCFECWLALWDSSSLNAPLPVSSVRIQLTSRCKQSRCQTRDPCWKENTRGHICLFLFNSQVGFAATVNIVR